MKYGYFSKDGNEYVITRPDTPRPWYNRIGNGRYALVISQTGGGYAVAGDEHRWLLNWYVPRYDESGRYLYVHDDDSGSFWSVGYVPVRARLDRFECRHGLGWTTLVGEKRQIETSMTVFVPVDEPVELWRIAVTNKSRSRRNVTLFPFLDWTIEDVPQHVDELVYAATSDGRYEKSTRSLVYARRNASKFNFLYGFMMSDRAPNGWDTNRASFVGAGRTLANPRAVEQGRCSNTPSYAEVSVTAMNLRLNLKPGETVHLNIMAGKTESAAERRRWRRKFFENGGVDRALELVKDYWWVVQNQVEIQTPDGMLNTYVNKWLLKHVGVMAGTPAVRMLNIGFRNYIQDAMGVLFINPSDARRHIVKSMHCQLASGDCPISWSAGGMPHGKPRHVDTKVWLVLAACSYIEQTGDFSILKEKAPFLDDKRQTTLLDRIHLVIRKCWKDRGMHGLSLIGHGDWNDNLTGMGREGKGVSVWMSEAVLWAIQKVAQLLEQTGDKAGVARLTKMATQMSGAINKHAWDGDRYIMGYTDHGRIVGGRKSPQVQMFVLPQSWAILSGAANAARCRKVVSSVKRFLSSEYGPLISNRSFSKKDESVGSITFLARGMSENGPVYSHAAAFMLCAYAEAGAGDLLYRDLMRLLPFTHDPAKTLAEPFVVSNFYRPAVVPRKHGATHRSWTTSTPNWLIKAVVEGMLGFKVEYGEIIFDPCIPRKWQKCRIKRNVRGVSFDVRIENPDGVEHGVREVWLEGERFAGNRVPFPESGKFFNVKVVMG